MARVPVRAAADPVRPAVTVMFEPEVDGARVALPRALNWRASSASALPALPRAIRARRCTRSLPLVPSREPPTALDAAEQLAGRGEEEFGENLIRRALRARRPRAGPLRVDRLRLPIEPHGHRRSRAGADGPHRERFAGSRSHGSGEGVVRGHEQAVPLVSRLDRLRSDDLGDRAPVPDVAHATRVAQVLSLAIRSAGRSLGHGRASAAARCSCSCSRLTCPDFC